MNNNLIQLSGILVKLAGILGTVSLVLFAFMLLRHDGQLHVYNNAYIVATAALSCYIVAMILRYFNGYNRLV